MIYQKRYLQKKALVMFLGLAYGIDTRLSLGGMFTYNTLSIPPTVKVVIVYFLLILISTLLVMKEKKD